MSNENSLAVIPQLLTYGFVPLDINIFLACCEIQKVIIS